MTHQVVSLFEAVRHSQQYEGYIRRSMMNRDARKAMCALDNDHDNATQELKYELGLDTVTQVAWWLGFNGEDVSDMSGKLDLYKRIKVWYHEQALGYSGVEVERVNAVDPFQVVHLPNFEVTSQQGLENEVGKSDLTVLDLEKKEQDQITKEIEEIGKYSIICKMSEIDNRSLKFGLKLISGVSIVGVLFGYFSSGMHNYYVQPYIDILLDTVK
jgi:hypothetical protein